MPIARIQSPDGRIARIEVPEGATQDQVLEFAAGEFEAAPAAAPSVTGQLLEPTTQALARGTVQATVGLPGAFLESQGLERLYGGQYKPGLESPDFYRQKAINVLRSEQLAIGLGPNELKTPSESEIATEAERQQMLDSLTVKVSEIGQGIRKRLDAANPRDALIKDALATLAVPAGRKMQDLAKAATESELLRDPYRETTPIGQRLREKPVQTVLTEGLEQLPNFAVSAGVASATRGALGTGRLGTLAGAGVASYALERGDIFNEGADVLVKQYGGRDKVPPAAWDKLNYFAENHGAFNAMLDAIAPSSVVDRSVLAKAGIERVMSKAGLKYIGKEYLKDFLLKELPQELTQELSTISAVEQATGRKLTDEETLARLTAVGVGTMLPVGAGSVSASVSNIRNAQPAAVAVAPEDQGAAPPSQAEVAQSTAPGASTAVPGVRGAARRVWTPRGKSVDTNLMVVEADQLITSHDESGNANPAFPEDLQPRDRSRTASQSQIASMSQSINPELLGDSGQSSSGAPIVGPDGVVESGNARTLALRKAYAAGRGEAYRQWLSANATRFGLDPDQISTLRQPVLVRSRTTALDQPGRVAFTQESNQADIAPLAPAEMARADASRITNQDLAQFAPSEDGNVLAASNEPFLRQFATRIGGLEAGGFTTADGRWTKQMADRVQAAIFTRAYDDERLTALQSEEADPEVRNILAGLTRAAPSFARARAVEPDLGNLNMTEHLVRATDLIRQARNEGRAVEELLNQQGLFGDIPPETAALARFMEANKRSARRMGEAFKMLGERIEDQLRGRQNGNLFGQDETTLADILRAVGDQMSERYGAETAQGDLLAQEPADEYRRSTFFSALERGVTAAKQPQATAKDWKAIIPKLPGVKAEEIEATGLNEWLDLQPGQVSREQVAEFVRQNGVQVREVTKGEQPKDVFIKPEQLTLTEGEWDWTGRAPDGSTAMVGKGTVQTEEEARLYLVRYLNANILARQQEKSERTSTKFASYQLPGGENYRELLLTLPISRELPAGFEARKKVNSATGREKWIIHGPGPLEENQYGSGATREEAINAFIGHGHTGAFRSSHFSEPNILAHVRFNERTDADGKRVLFIEEVQSDWGQKGRKEGFSDDVENSYSVVQDQENGGEFRVIQKGKSGYVTVNGTTKWETAFDAKADLDTHIERLKKSNFFVPSAPFVTKTESWAMLAMKRMIRYAAKNGFDRIAWTTGEQQADRYDISQQVDTVRVIKHADNDFSIEGEKNRVVVINKYHVAQKELPEYVGKDLSDKAIKDLSDRNAGHEDYSGLDLKVGGEGMRSFYDQMLPQWVNKYIKKFGGKVITVPLSPKTQLTWRMDQPGFDITPAMRDQALEGQPLFEPKPGDTDQIPITETAPVALDTQRKTEGAGTEQLELFTAPGTTPVSNQQLRRIANETPQVGLVRTGMFRTAIKRITGAADAAHVIAGIRKEAQENIVAIATDADGNIVGILRHGIGGQASVSTYPGVLLGAITAMPGARKVWFAHNHPSGQIKQSSADRKLTDSLDMTMANTGLEMMGMLVVAPNARQASLYKPDSGATENLPITPGVRRESVPISERRFVKVRHGDRDQIGNERQAVEQMRSVMGEDAGILLTDTQIRPLGYVAMTPAEMRRLRTGNIESGAGAILRAIHEANATGAFVRVPESTAKGEASEAADNMKGFFAAIGSTQLHDVFQGEARIMDTSTPGTFYMNPVGPVYDSIKNAARRLRDAMGERDYGVKVVGREEALDPGLLTPFLSPSTVANSYPVLARYLQWGQLATEVQEKLRNAFGRRMHAVEEALGAKPLVPNWTNADFKRNKTLLWQLMIAEDAGGARMTEDELRSSGANDQIVNAHRLMRSAYDRALGIANKAREARGKDPINRREGYVPHFFHSYFIVVDGHIAGSARTLREAVKMANPLAREGHKIRLVPKQFQFPGESIQAAVLGDGDYFRMAGRIEKEFSMTQEEAQEFLDGLVRRRGRSRFVGNFLERKGVEGWEQNLDWAHRHYFNMISRYAALDQFKSKAISAFERDFGGFDKDAKGIARYIKNYINDINGNPTVAEELINASLAKVPALGKWLGAYFGDRPALQMASGFTNAVAVAKLGLYNVSAAVVNAIQVINTQTLIGPRWSASGMRRWTRIEAHLLGRKIGLETGVSRDMGLLKQMGVDISMGLASGAGYSKAGPGSLFRHSTAFFQGVERFNRATAGLGAYYKGRAEGRSHQHAIDYAKSVIERTQFDYSIADAPAFIRRSGPVGQVLFQFKKFPVKQLEFMVSLRGAEKARFWIPFFLLAGYYALPGIELLKNLVRDIFDVDMELEMKKWLMEWAGDDPERQAVANQIMRGILGHVGIDITKRVGAGDFIPSELRDLTGPGISSAVRAAQMAAKGEWIETLRAMSTAPGNLVKAIANDGELTDPSNRERSIIKLTPAERVMASVGFQPERVSLESDTARIIRYETRKVQQARKEIIDAIIEASKLADAGKQEQADAKAKRIMERVDRMQIGLTAEQIENEITQKSLTRAQRAWINASPEIKARTGRVMEFHESRQPEAP